MPTLSVVMIVKDEAECLAACLASIADIADEIVIADTGSTDDTPAIARRFNAKITSIPWHDDFAEARNHALALASGDWLLNLDADELLAPDDAQQIREIVNNDGCGADAVELTLANYCDDARAWRWKPVLYDSSYAKGHAGYIAVELPRLFRNHRGYAYREPVHENVTESLVETGARIGCAPILIHHYGYRSQDNALDEKARRYLRILERKVEEQPNAAKGWHELAEQLLSFGETARAEAACRTALKLEPEQLAAATTLANILLNRGELDEARKVLEDIEMRGQSAPHIDTALGAIAYKRGKLEEAHRRLERVVHTADNPVMARLYLARVCDLEDAPDVAAEHLAQAIRIAPTIQEPRDRATAHQLRRNGEQLFKSGQSKRALEVLVESLRLDPEDPVTQNDLGVVLTELGELTQAKECFERALQLTSAMSSARQNLHALLANEHH